MFSYNSVTPSVSLYKYTSAHSIRLRDLPEGKVSYDKLFNEKPLQVTNLFSYINFPVILVSARKYWKRL